MKDRIPQNPGRVLITPENGSTPFYATLERADNPVQEGDALNKANLLSDATATRLGLGTDAVVNDALGKLSEINLHWWKRRKETRGENPVESTSTVAEHTFEVSGSTSYGVTTTFLYASNYIFENGGYTLVNPTELAIDMNSVSSASSKLKGKYFKEKYATNFDTEMWFGTDSVSIMRVQSGSSYRATGKNLIKYSVAKQYYENFGTWAYLSSTNANAYPQSGEQSGYTYYYLGKPLNNARDEESNPRPRKSGTYIGNGEDKVTRTLRLSDAGSTGGMLSIATGGPVHSLVTWGGGIVFRYDTGDCNFYPPEEVNYRNGVLSLKTGSYYFNGNTSTYFYTVL